jgi:hypothetical protein
MSDVRQWARENVLAWTEDDWLWARYAVTGRDRTGKRVALEPLLVEQAHAALAHLREVAEGLTDLQREWLCDVLVADGHAAPGNRGDVRCLLNLQSKGLAYESGPEGAFGRRFEARSLGHAVARYLERQR